MPPILAPVWWTHAVEYYEEAPVLPYAYAPWPRRIASSLIDLFVLAAISAPFVVSLLGETADISKATNAEIRTLTIVGIIGQIVYFTAMHAWRGSTIGKMAMRTVLVRDDGSAVTPAVAFTRAVTVVGINFVSGFLIGIPAVVNVLRPLWNPRRQTFHDQIARTVVVLNTPR